MIRLGLSGAQGTGKTTLAKHLAQEHGYRYLDAGIGEAMSKMGVKVGSPMPMLARLHVQLALIDHLGDVTSGAKGFVTDRTPFDIMAYTLDMVSTTNDDACRSVFDVISRRCAEVIENNFNAVVCVRPGVSLSHEDYSRQQRASLDPIYVRRIDRLICGEMNSDSIGNSQYRVMVGFMPPAVTDLNRRAELVLKFVDGNLQGHAPKPGSTLH